MIQEPITRNFNTNRWAPIPALLCLFLLPGCIGTDYVDELLGPDLSRVVIDEPSVELLLGEQYTLMAEYYDHSGRPASTPIIWTSRNESVATVDAEGVVTAAGLGQTEVIASVQNGPRDSLLVTVVGDPGAVASIEITGSTNSLMPGESVQLTATVRNFAGDVLSGIPLSWTSSAPLIVTVDGQGLAEGVSEGMAMIRATAEGVMSPAFEITVSGSDNLTGTFMGASGYNASGKVTIFEENGSFVVQLGADFESQSGPGLHVYLSPSKDSGSNGVDLGALQSISGEQSYNVPDGVNPNDYDFVLIYCKPFGVVFAYAELE
jgi:hypothetical protein